MLVNWQSNIGTSTILTGKPYLYYFDTSWSHACRELEHDSFQNTEIVATINEKYVPIRITDVAVEKGKNPTDIQELESKYGITSFPSIVIALPDGTWISELDGFVKRSGVKRFFNRQGDLFSFYAGREAFAQGKFDQAQQAFGDYIAKVGTTEHGRFLFASLWRYACLKYLGKDNDAQQCLDAALVVADKDPAWPSGLIRYLSGKTKYDDMAKENDPTMHATLAIITYAQHNNDECAKHLEQMLSKKFYRSYFEYRAARYVLSQLPEQLRKPLEDKYGY
jgi:thiol-disulfide isomerase/thioredoxin